MGKVKGGSYPEGNFSDSKKDESASAGNPFSGSVEQYQELTHTTGQDEVPANAKVRHPNRNLNKEERRAEKNSNKNTGKNRSQNLDDGQTVTTAQELPGVLTKDLFQSLVSFKGDFCVSVYLPTHRSGVEVNQLEDGIMFKNALQEIASDLKNKGVDQVRIQRMLEPGYELLRDIGFWRNQELGLAVFIADDYFKFVKMPDTPMREWLINSSFMVKPLVNAMTIKEYFYLLVVSKKQAKFFKADAFGMQQVKLDELPNGVDDVVHLEAKDDQKLFRTEAFHGGKGGAFHGHGAGKPDEKENIAMYLEEVDETLWEEVLNRENVPLLLAGVEYLLPIYKSVSGYRFIWDEVLKGSHEHDDPNALFAMARKIMEPYFQQRTKKALEQYGKQSATALTSTNASEIIPAAHYGRIWHLFLLRDLHLWGTFNEQENILDLHDDKKEGDECLVDKAVIKTILNGGDVHFVSREDMPTDSEIAALMRY